MRRSLLIVGILLLCGSFARSQVVSDFSSSKYFFDENWGKLIDSIYIATDPASSTGKALALSLTCDGTGTSEYDAIGNSNGLDVSTAQALTFWVYLPTGTPDSLNVQLWYQPHSSWNWNSWDYYAVNLPKDKWFPLTVYTQAHSISNSKDGVSSTYPVSFGIQPAMSVTAGKTAWSGKIYIKDVELVGVQPTTVQDFSTSLGSYGLGWSNGWTYKITDSTVSSKGAAYVRIDTPATNESYTLFFGSSSGNSTYASADNRQLVFWVYADSTLADSISIQPYTQDRATWNNPSPYSGTVYYGKDIPKNVWYPLYFDISWAAAVDGTTFVPSTSGLGWIGLLIGGRPGSVFVQRIEIASTIVAKELPLWTAATFTSGLNAFIVPSYAATGTSIKRYLDLTSSNPSYVLQGTAAITSKTTKFAAVRDSISLKDAADSIAVSASIQVYVPRAIPAKGLVKFYLSGGTGDSVAVVDTIGSQVALGDWTTLTIDSLDVKAEQGIFNPAKKTRVGVEIYFPFDTTFSGKIELDNLIFKGIWFAGEVGATGVETTNGTVKAFQLYASYPNPFNPSTTIKYDVQKLTQVQIKIYDILGREIETLVNDKRDAGSYQVTFDASMLTSGIYFVRMNAGSYVKTQRIALIK